MQTSDHGEKRLVDVSSFWQQLWNMMQGRRAALHSLE